MTKLKQKAVETGLMQEVDRLRHQLHYRTFNNLTRLGAEGPVFIRLEEALDEADDIVRKMRLCLIELRGVEPLHR